MVFIKSNLRELMGKRKIKTVKELGRMANLSWKVINNLDDEKDIDTIQLGNLLKVCLALNCTLDQLIEIDYKELIISNAIE